MIAFKFRFIGKMYIFGYTIFFMSTVVSLLPLSLGHHMTATCLDCHTLKLSSRFDSSLVNCTTTDLPYCDPSTSSCSSTPPPQCVNPDNFTCVSDGYFPDPWDCRGFHLCVDQAPTKYFCNPDTWSYYNFDVILHRCTPSARCGYKCSGKTGVKVTHPDDANLFAYCFNGIALLQDRCPGNYELNEATQKCEAVCRTNGVLADVEDCTKYYRCIYQNFGYYRSHERCADGHGFNPLTLQCEEDSVHCKTADSATTGDGIWLNETTPVAE